MEPGSDNDIVARGLLNTNRIQPGFTGLQGSGHRFAAAANFSRFLKAPLSKKLSGAAASVSFEATDMLSVFASATFPSSFGPHPPGRSGAERMGPKDEGKVATVSVTVSDRFQLRES